MAAILCKGLWTPIYFKYFLSFEIFIINIHQKIYTTYAPPPVINN